MTQETFSFQAEVSKLLNIVAQSLYSHKEIFLRELISNASDACDKRRYRVLTEAGLAPDRDYDIRIKTDADARTVSVADNGIGMDRQDLLDTLGTIARSGTQAFMESLEADQRKERDLIGQFGVGFYSSFMVADRVEVVTRKAGEEKAWKWSSDGQGSFAIEEAARDEVGTTVTVFLKTDESEFATPGRVRDIVKRYSDHIAFPVLLEGVEKAKDGGGDWDETLNKGSALWSRDKSDITDDQYTEFYHHTAHAFDDPWMVIHNSVEGVISYTNLLFVPSTPPFDLFHPERKSNIRLYVNRVFITDDTESLMPGYLRFVKGIVDSPDLTLNVSREMLQHDPKLAKIRSGLVKRVLSELEKKSEKDTEGYRAFWENFGAVLKEGIYEDAQQREKLLGLARFQTTEGDQPIALKAYVERMKEGQDAIYYLTGDDAEQMAASPQLEGFRAKGVEVLLLTDAVDEFWVPTVGEFDGKPFKSVAQGAASLDAVKNTGEKTDEKIEDEAPTDTPIDGLIAAFKAALGDGVKDVRASDRLTESAVCLVADDGDMGMHLEKLLRKQGHGKGLESKRILEINPKHALIRRLAERASDGAEQVADAAHLLLDQARIIEGESPADPRAFAKRLASVLEAGV